MRLKITFPCRWMETTSPAHDVTERGQTADAVSVWLRQRLEACFAFSLFSFFHHCEKTTSAHELSPLAAIWPPLSKALFVTLQKQAKLGIAGAAAGVVLPAELRR